MVLVHDPQMTSVIVPHIQYMDSMFYVAPTNESKKVRSGLWFPWINMLVLDIHTLTC